MKRSGSLIAVLFALVLVIFILPRLRGVAPTPSVFDDQLTLGEALERGEQTGRPVLVVVTADWCGACQSFKRGALADSDVEQLVRESFVPVYLNADEQRGEVSQIGNIEYLPTSVVIWNGQEIERATGSKPAGKFAALLREALAKATRAG